ncbi:MAG: branched-chain amino acid transport system permease protein [Rhodospirillaceae bacterium]|jgi:branched-chain amino acid transport system permease protein|nr:branched-chain amino acid transport system permease protein [Rhodospirillaceae bacterium]
MTSYLLTVGVFGCLYGLLAMGLSIQWGLTGLVNFGQVAFFALGAYGSAILSLQGVPIVASMLAGTVVAGLVGAFVATSTLRLREDYLALVTLGLGEVIRLFATNEMWLTGGAGGLPGIPRLFPFSASGLGDLPFLALALILVAATWFFLHRSDRSPFGRVLKAIREDEAVPRSLGRNVFSFKVQAFTAGAAIAGLSGAFFAHYVSLAIPDQFLPIVTIYAWVAVMLGGQGNHLGAFVGAICLMAVLELTRFAKDYMPFLQGEQLAAARVMLVGVLLIVLVKYFPNGVLRRSRSR